MNPLLWAKLAGTVALVALIFFGGWHLGGLKGQADVARLERDQAQNTATAVMNERASAQAIALTDRQAETTHDQDLEAIPLHIRHDSVFVRIPGPTPDCPVPGAKAQAGGKDPSGGGIQPGPRDRDIRPGLEALKVKYETALADCRRLDAEWPK